MSERFERTGEWRSVETGEWFERDDNTRAPLRCINVDDVVGKHWILRRVDEPVKTAFCERHGSHLAAKPCPLCEPVKEPEYRTAEECASEICDALCVDRNGTIWEEVVKHLSRYRPIDRDAVIEECIQTLDKMHGLTSNEERERAYSNCVSVLKSLKGAP